MKFLVDANVLAEMTKATPSAKVIDWLRQNEPDLSVDPIILGEIRFGILLLPSGKRRRTLEHWFTNVVSKIECIQWDASVGLRWAQLLADLRFGGRAMSVKDGLIAASALTHGFTIATRNTADFNFAGAKLIDPFK